jgi:hypothetical protein
MKKLLLTQKGRDILGSDGLLHIDGRLSLNSIKNKVAERNNRYLKNFPHKIADGFYITDSRLNKISPIYSL